MRVVNSGRREFALDAEYTQRWVNGTWRPMRLPPTFISGLALTFIHPESVSKGIGPITLRRWPPGKYRWLLGVKAVHGTSFRATHFVHAVFRLRRK
jgi:hypothetical protein